MIDVGEVARALLEDIGPAFVHDNAGAQRVVAACLARFPGLSGKEINAALDIAIELAAADQAFREAGDGAS